jgi:hypothetical protein
VVINSLLITVILIVCSCLLESIPDEQLTSNVLMLTQSKSLIWDFIHLNCDCKYQFRYFQIRNLKTACINLSQIVLLESYVHFSTFYTYIGLCGLVPVNSFFEGVIVVTIYYVELVI